MPDYEIILWDMNRFDIHSVPFVMQACAARKWAYAADYIRWYALYTEGGIYLDSDVKVYRRLDKFLIHRAFFGISNFDEPMPGELLGKQNWIEAECFGAEKGHPLMKSCMEVYENTTFQTINGVATIGVAPVVLSNVCTAYGWENNRKVKSWLYLQEGIVIYPEKYFSFATGKLSFFHTHAMHIRIGSWKNNNNSFVPKNDFLFIFRRWHVNMTEKYWWFRRYYYKRKELQKRIIELLKI